MDAYHGAGSLAALIAWMRAGTVAFEAAVLALDDVEFAQPCALAGWTRAHLVSHIARNADALGNLLRWARTGVETPMYADAAARSAGIEAGATRPATELRADLLTANEEFDAAIEAMPEAAWSGAAKSALGRPITAEEVPWMRIREVWVHLVDLANGHTFDDVPREVGVALLDDATAWLGARNDGPAVRISASDGGPAWSIEGVDHAAVEVAAPLSSLVEWVLGRGAPDELGSDAGPLPKLPRWL